MFHGVREEQLDRLRTDDRLDARAAESAIVAELPDWIAQIERNADAGEAFGQLVALTASLNAAIAIRSSIIEKIEKHIDSMRQGLATISERLGAESFSIGVSVPVGLSVSVSFRVKPA